MKSSARKTMAALPLLLLAALLIGCGGAADDPEQRIRALIVDAEQAAEAGSTRRVMRHVSEAYRDEAGRDKSELRNLVRAYLFQQDSLQLVTRIRHIEVATAYRAHAEVQLGLAGDAAERARSMTGLNANNLQLQLTFDREADDEWRLIRADWSRGSE
ncbi:hypothetical protein J2T60_002265 [Natronospira proteinivora]|uniref:DUF4878 domain-containing protein n=1 Tax=Natronospira proteinivora TaxID=1807133 RepID=A0ABT1GAC3_9GAMM|nr:hypothetical protein [Natronospira proteinivora]MCP1728265.1 hypothetical protein [Natronospira proteinivora]